jgi:hypothetical protein
MRMRFSSLKINLSNSWGDETSNSFQSCLTREAVRVRALCCLLTLAYHDPREKTIIRCLRESFTYTQVLD